MTRIIAGLAKGRRLATPPGDATRPTSDRVREALFSAMESWCGSLQEIRFLDLYAGSGAVGIEAWSRGAQTVLLVEQFPATARLATANVRTVGAEGVEVVTASVSTVLGSRPSEPYDVVFSDPPYPHTTEQVEEDLALLVARGWVHDDSLVVVERSSRGVALNWPAGLVGERERRYGETVLWYGRAVGAGTGPEPVSQEEM